MFPISPAASRFCEFFHKVAGFERNQFLLITPPRRGHEHNLSHKASNTSIKRPLADGTSHEHHVIDSTVEEAHRLFDPFHREPAALV